MGYDLVLRKMPAKLTGSRGFDWVCIIGCLRIVDFPLEAPLDPGPWDDHWRTSIEAPRGLAVACPSGF
jgi:hypothetical protein